MEHIQTKQAQHLYFLSSLQKGMKAFKYNVVESRQSVLKAELFLRYVSIVFHKTDV